jgi:NTE family protein
MELRTAMSGPVDLVLQGGGIKAIGLAGAMDALAERGIFIHRIAGASGGAVVAGLTAAGYSPRDLRQIIETEPFLELLDSRWYTTLPLIGKPLAIFWRMGMHPGDRLQARLAELLEAKGIFRFGDLRDGIDVYPLQVVVSDVTARRLLLFPRDAALFGIEPDSLSVALALRMSSGIPVVYEPVRLKHAIESTEHLLVDGGMLSNFPIWVFDSTTEPDVPVIGLRLVDDQPGDSMSERLPVPAFTRTRLGQLIDYVESLARTMMEAHDRRYLDTADIERAIQVPTLGIGTTEFDLSAERIEELYQAGKQAVYNALDEPD